MTNQFVLPIHLNNSLLCPRLVVYGSKDGDCPGVVRIDVEEAPDHSGAFSETFDLHWSDDVTLADNACRRDSCPLLTICPGAILTITRRPLPLLHKRILLRFRGIDTATVRLEDEFRYVGHRTWTCRQRLFCASGRAADEHVRSCLSADWVRYMPIHKL